MVSSKQIMEIKEESAANVPGHTLFISENLLRSLLKVVPPEILSCPPWKTFFFLVVAYVNPPFVPPPPPPPLQKLFPLHTKIA